MKSPLSIQTLGFSCLPQEVNGLLEEQTSILKKMKYMVYYISILKIP
ncbi:hypothetical protein DOK79_003019 [Enterococcus sp. DIV1094]|uniref:Uncharacterized protein n=1 Tax=Candidatus Enterococcus mangumiae TaxID=2230878 RepID=A0ABZ2T0D0_9ENTE